MKKPDHCRGCVFLISHQHKKSLTAEQLRHDNWCCAKGKPAAKSLALCKTHNLKRLRDG
jgi:hypothetical protein